MLKFWLLLTLVCSLNAKELSEIFVDYNGTKVPVSDINWNYQMKTSGYSKVMASEPLPKLRYETIVIDFFGFDEKGKLAKENSVTRNIPNTKSESVSTLKIKIRPIAYDLRSGRGQFNNLFSEGDTWEELNSNDIVVKKSGDNLGGALGGMNAVSAAGGSDALAIGFGLFLATGADETGNLQALYKVDFDYKDGRKQTIYVKLLKTSAKNADKYLWKLFDNFFIG